jgi:uncharacterized protein YegL
MIHNNPFNYNPAPTNIGANFNAKRAGAKTSHVVFVLDDSASMRNCRDTTISGFNEFLQAQVADDKKTNIKTYISLVKFDGAGVKQVYSYVRAKKVAPLTENDYDPRGLTNLYDAIGSTITTINNQLTEQAKADRPAPIITILTDGNENASKVYSSVDVKQMVEKAEGKNWTFMFLGANIDTFAVGSALGFSAHNSTSYNTKNMGETMFAATSRVSNMKVMRAAGATTAMVYSDTQFSDKEKADMNNE